jgi:hypothetical protein
MLYFFIIGLYEKMIYGLLKRFLKATSTGTKEKVAKTMIF